MKTLTEKQVLTAIDKEEFGADVIQTAETVVVVLTQDWCPQWGDLKGWIAEACREAGAALFVHEYNTHKHFDEFLRLKEDVWRNREIPYVRIYRKGKLMKETNYVSSSRFGAMLK